MSRKFRDETNVTMANASYFYVVPSGLNNYDYIIIGSQNEFIINQSSESKTSQQNCKGGM